MKRVFHLGVTLLCLLAIAVAPVLCPHALRAAHPGCAQEMGRTMPMPAIPTSQAMLPMDLHHEQPGLPPCCVVHPADHSALLAAAPEQLAMWSAPAMLPVMARPLPPAERTLSAAVLRSPPPLTPVSQTPLRI